MCERVGRSCPIPATLAEAVVEGRRLLVVRPVIPGEDNDDDHHNARRSDDTTGEGASGAAQPPGEDVDVCPPPRASSAAAAAAAVAAAPDSVAADEFEEVRTEGAILNPSGEGARTEQTSLQQSRLIFGAGGGSWCVVGCTLMKEGSEKCFRALLWSLPRCRRSRQGLT